MVRTQRSFVSGLFGLLLVGLVAGVAGAQEAKKPGESAALSYIVDARTNLKHADAYEKLSNEEYEESLKILNRLRMRSMNPLERAKTHRIYGYVYNGMGNLDKTREHLELAVTENALGHEAHTDIRFQLAQIDMQQEKWPDVVKNLNQWFEMVEEPNAFAYYLLAIAYYQLEDVDSALEPAQKAVELTDEPREPWLQLLLALRLTQRDYEASVPLLERLAKDFPKKSYWVQLSTVNGALGNYEEALVPLQLAYSQDLLDDEDDLLKLAQLLLFLDLPYRAAGVIAKGIDDGVIKESKKALELLGNTRIAAKEYEAAVAPLAEAAELDEKGGLFVRLAQVHIQREEWDRATKALERALAKGVDDVGGVQLLMGIAYYSAEETGQALKWFSRASQHKKSRDQARTWLGFLEREMAAAAASSTG